MRQITDSRYGEAMQLAVKVLQECDIDYFERDIRKVARIQPLDDDLLMWIVRRVGKAVNAAFVLYGELSE